MNRRPGGELASRPLHFIWLCDCSGSMSLDGKIDSLNNSIRETVPDMRKVADENPNAQVYVHTLGFSHGAKWLTSEPIKLEIFEWNDLAADPLQRPSVDIVFMMDTSGSMHDEIEAVKKSCTVFADNIIDQGANVRLGLIGFDIGGHRGGTEKNYKVHNLSKYTIGIWSLSSPQDFQRNVQSLTLGLFGGGGCYLANRDTIDIFPHVNKAFDGAPENIRILVIISDEIGGSEGVQEIIKQLNSGSIKTHVLGVSGYSRAHEAIAEKTGGKFWNIMQTKGINDFSTLLESVAGSIAKEVSQKLSDGTISAGTDLGAALELVSDRLKIPPMSDRALPPVVVLISDGQPTDDFETGLKLLMDQPWGKKAVRIAIAIGRDADLGVLQKFIGHPGLKPLQANNPGSLVKFIKWASTAVLRSASSPPSQAQNSSRGMMNVPLPEVPAQEESVDAGSVW